MFPAVPANGSIPSGLMACVLAHEVVFGSAVVGWRVPNKPHGCARWLATRRTPRLGMRLRAFGSTRAALTAAVSKTFEAKRFGIRRGPGPNREITSGGFLSGF